MAYTFSFGDVKLPIAPPSVEYKIRNQNKTITLMNYGEVNILKKAGLTEVKMDVRIPQTPYPFASYPDGFKDAHYFLDVFELLKVSQKPFTFSISRKLPNGVLLYDYNEEVSLEDYQIKEDAKEGFDLIIGVNLKHYREYGAKIANINADGTAQPENDRSDDSAPEITTYTVESGDCLWNIAKKYLGDASRWQEIYELNKDKIVNPNLIYPGQVLTMP